MFLGGCVDSWCCVINRTLNPEGSVIINLRYKEPSLNCTALKFLKLFLIPLLFSARLHLIQNTLISIDPLSFSIPLWAVHIYCQRFGVCPSLHPPRRLLLPLAVGWMAVMVLWTQNYHRRIQPITINVCTLMLVRWLGEEAELEWYSIETTLRPLLLFMPWNHQRNNITPTHSLNLRKA